MAEAVQKKEERFWQLFEEVGTGVALLDLMGHIEASNPALCAMLSSTSEELADRWLTELVHPIYKTETTRLLQEVIEGGQNESRSEVGLVRRDGTLAWSRLSLFLARNRSGQPD